MTCLIIPIEILRREDSLSELAGAWDEILFKNFSSRSNFGRPVGSGKTALTLALCQKLRKEFNIGLFQMIGCENT